MNDIPDGAEPWAVVILVGVGLLLIASAGFFRLGRLRYLARYYWDDEMPYYLRNLPFAYGPFGLFLTLMGAAAQASSLGPPADVAIGGAAMAVSLFAFVIGLRWLGRPPLCLMPAWLRQDERMRGRVARRELVDRLLVGIFVVLTILVLPLMAIAAIGGFVVWVAQ